MKKGRGKSGVEFCFYNDKEYKQLSPTQKKKLKENREGQVKKGPNKSPPEKKRFLKGDYANKKKKFDSNKRR